jgi:hypothetical protein
MLKVACELQPSEDRKRKSVSVGRYKSDNYHFLRSSLGQSVAVAEVIDFNVLDVVAVLGVNLAVNRGWLNVFARRRLGNSQSFAALRSIRARIGIVVLRFESEALRHAGFLSSQRFALGYELLPPLLPPPGLPWDCGLEQDCDFVQQACATEESASDGRIAMVAWARFGRSASASWVPRP